MLFDFKKTERNLYQPKTTPSIIDVPEMIFLAVEDKGDPNISEAYKTALEVLYGLSYSIKMSKRLVAFAPNGYFEYVVPPLEGLWWPLSGGVVNYSDKDNLCWISMIRQPGFVTPVVLSEAQKALAKKKLGIDLSKVRLMKMAEGLCVQVMHAGPYDNEPATVAAMEQYALENGYAIDLTDTRRHHEIYLSDPRKVAPEKLKTIIRHPVKGYSSEPSLVLPA